MDGRKRSQVSPVQRSRRITGSSFEATRPKSKPTFFLSLFRSLAKPARRLLSGPSTSVRPAGLPPICATGPLRACFCVISCVTSALPIHLRCYDCNGRRSALREIFRKFHKASRKLLSLSRKSWRSAARLHSSAAKRQREERDFLFLRNYSAQQSNRDFISQVLLVSQKTKRAISRRDEPCRGSCITRNTMKSKRIYQKEKKKKNFNPFRAPF